MSASHRGPPRGPTADVTALLHGTLGKLALAGVGLLAGTATAVLAFINTQLDNLGDQTNEVVEQVSTGLERTNQQLDDQADAGARDLERLAKALRDLEQQTPPDTAPAPRTAEDTTPPRDAPQHKTNPRPPTTHATTAAQPRVTPTPSPLQEFCATTTLCQEDS